MEKAKILVVEDNLLVSSAVKDILEEESFEAVIAEDGKTATELLKSGTFQTALLDMMLPDTDGRKLLKAWQKEHPAMPVVVMTAHADIPTAVECLRAGAYDFLVKPVERPLLLKTIRNALDHSRMAKKVTILTELTHRETAPDVTGEVIAESPLMRKTLEMARQVAASDFSCLLITGESGTGKGLLAKTIHKMGGRADKPFVEVNCSALPTNLVESELFGHKRGAFTDAKENKLGLFEVADTGTLFLDEIGDMDFNLQAKLLKVIEEQKFRRIGDTNDISVDVSIIAATNQNVEQAVKENKFRIDLYYRLNVIPIHIPPLRDRKEDIPALTRHFISFFSRKFGREIAGVEEDAMESLLVYDWPGNIREFRNVIERGCILTRERTISDPSLLFPMGGPVLPVAGGGADADNITSLPAMPLKDAEKMVIRAAMEQARNNRNLAAQILGLHRSTLYKKLEEYGLG